MISLKKKITVTLSTGILFALMSCDSGENIYDLDKPGEIDEIKKEILEETGDILAYQITMNSQGELETSFDVVDIVTSADATEGTLNRNSFQLIGSGEPRVTVIDNEYFVKSYLSNDAKKISEINFSIIEKNIAAAKSQIPAQYVDPTIYQYKIEFDGDKRADTFIINCLEENEGTHMEGRDIVTNYYEFLFEIEEDGSVTMLED